MNLTVCELPHEPDRLEAAWEGLVAHCAAAGSDAVLLPEMPFSVWLAATKEVDPARWDAAVAVHEKWLSRLDELGTTTVLGSRPVVDDGRRLNEAFVWEQGAARPAHHKYYLPDEEGFFEASWYERGAREFEIAPSEAGSVGFLICTEVWFTEHARAYAREGATILANPRATEWSTREKWLAGGRTAAVMAGAFCLSSNHSGLDELGMRWGGLGWIIDPDGEVLATTSDAKPFATVEVDPLLAEGAKQTYPRYVAE